MRGTWETMRKRQDSLFGAGAVLAEWVLGRRRECSDQKWRAEADDDEVGELRRRRPKQHPPPPLRGAPIYPPLSPSHAVSYVIADSTFSVAALGRCSQTLARSDSCRIHICNCNCNEDNKKSTP